MRTRFHLLQSIATVLEKAELRHLANNFIRPGVAEVHQNIVNFVVSH